MNERGQSKFEERLNSILLSEGDVNQALDDLDEEEKVQLPMVVEYKPVPSVVTENESLSKDLIDDYKHVRNTLYGLIERGTVALEGSLMIARESEHPRAYEVASSLMRNLSEISKDLLDLQANLKPTAAAKIGKQVNQQINVYGEGNSESKDINQMLDDLED